MSEILLYRHSLRLILGMALLCLLPAAWAQDPDSLPKLNLDQPLRPDFSGAWEKDFTRSDSWETELDRLIRIREEALERQRRQSSGDIGIRQGPALGGGGGRRGAANMVNLARLAEYISRQTTLQIDQTRFEVRIEREGDAALICGIEDGAITSFSSEHGTEICGWDRQQLIFQLRLPDELFITYRFTLSSDRQMLNLLLSISSRGSDPFTLRQAYNRYNAPADDFNCIQTLSRGRVCSQRTPLP